MNKLAPLTLILADPQAIVRDGLAAVCRKHFTVSVLGQFSNGQEALEGILARNPEFAVVNIDEPRPGGPPFVQQVREAGSTTRLIALSYNHDASCVEVLIRYGLDGYVLRDGSSEQIPDAINSIRDGVTYVSPLIRRDSIRSEETPAPKLSPREYEIYTYLVHGLRNGEIANSLGLSPKTVHTYRTNLMRKLEVHSLAELVHFDIQRNLTRAAGSVLSGYHNKWIYR